MRRRRTSALKEESAGLGATLLGWLPLMGATLFCVQVVFSGLLPSLARSRQLDADEATMEARVAEILDDRAEVEDERRMLNDEIYRERVRRTLRDPRQRNLSLYGPGTPRAFGHLGFISIYCWADPQRDLSGALLTTGKGLIGPHLPALVRLQMTINRQCQAA